MGSVEGIIFLGDRGTAEIWNNCRRAMEQVGGRGLMSKLKSELMAEGHNYAVVKEKRVVHNPFSNILELRWDLKPTPDRWLSRGVKLESDGDGKISVYYTGETRRWKGLDGKGMSLEEKTRLAMSLATHYPDRFYGNRVENTVQRIISFLEARKVA